MGCSIGFGLSSPKVSARNANEPETHYNKKQQTATKYLGLALTSWGWGEKVSSHNGALLLLGGQQILPAKVLASGFEFRHPTLASALAAMFGAKPARTIAEASQPTCLAQGEPGSAAATLARVVSPPLQSRDRIAPASVELARRRD